MSLSAGGRSLYSGPHRVPLLGVAAGLLILAAVFKGVAIPGGPASGALLLDAQRLGRGARWTPFDLSIQDLIAGRDISQLKVTSMVSPQRRLLTVNLAIGALTRGVPGDFVECGVASGGTLVLLLTTLLKYDPDGTRVVWAADSFRGLPEPGEEDRNGSLAVGKAGAYGRARGAVDGELRRFKLAQDRVRFLAGWFNETLPTAPIEKISFLRLDGDLYVSTRDPLEALYDKVQPGGLIYVDDYGSFNGCKQAIDEFRAERGITDKMNYQQEADYGGSRFEAVWWVKTR